MFNKIKNIFAKKERAEVKKQEPSSSKIINHSGPSKEFGTNLSSSRVTHSSSSRRFEDDNGSIFRDAQQSAVLSAYISDSDSYSSRHSDNNCSSSHSSSSHSYDSGGSSSYDSCSSDSSSSSSSWD